MSHTAPHPIKSQPSFGMSWLVLLASAALLIVLDIMDGSALLADMDDGLRRVQIRDLLSDNQWFDRRLPKVVGYDSHWSRIVDLPYYGLAKALGLFMTADAAFLWASRIVPLGLLIALCAIVTAITRRIASLAQLPVPGLVALFFTTWIGVIGFLEFAPARIDHHNAQILCLCAAVLGLLSARPKHGGLIMGLAIIASLSIGLEVLPIIIILLAAMVMTAASGDSSMRLKTQSLGLTLLLFTAPFNALFIGKAGLFVTQCDAVSAPWVLGLMGGGALLWAVPYFWRAEGATRGQKLIRLLVVGLMSAGLVAALGAMFPKCLAGPFEMISPTAHALWLSDIAQEHSVFWLFGYEGYGLQTGLVITYTAAACIFAALFQSVIKSWPNALKILAALTVISVVITVFQFRHVRLSAVLLALFFPLALSRYTAQKPAVLKSLRAPVTALLILPVALLYAAQFLTPKVDEINSARDLLRFDSCQDVDFSALSDIAPGVIIAPFGLSQSLLEVDSPQTLAAISFQRASSGIDDVLSVFFSGDSTARISAAARYDYLAVCRVNTDMDLSESPLYAALNAGKPWPGLIDITPPDMGRFTIYQITPNFR